MRKGVACTALTGLSMTMSRTSNEGVRTDRERAQTKGGVEHCGVWTERDKAQGQRLTRNANGGSAANDRVRRQGGVGGAIGIGRNSAKS
jgi:hypothetical protein